MNLEQEGGGASGPSHRLRLFHSPIEQEVRRAFSDRSSDTQPGPVSLGVIDQPRALAATARDAFHSLPDGTPLVRWPRSPWKACMSWWMRSMPR